MGRCISTRWTVCVAVSAGATSANGSATGARHYGNIRATAEKWLQEVEIPLAHRRPAHHLSGGAQRLQIARNLVTQPKLVLRMNPPAGWMCPCWRGCQTAARPGGGAESGGGDCYHDLGVARLLANRLLVMKQGQVVESGLTDRVLDDPHHPYTQLLVSSCCRINAVLPGGGCALPGPQVLLRPVSEAPPGNSTP